MKELTAEPDNFTSRWAKSNIRLFCWIFIWVGTMVAVDKAELYGWFTSDLMTMAAIVINAGLGVGVIMTFMRMLRESDELQQKIQLNALALSMGVGLVGSFTYSLLVTAKFVIDNEVSDIILLMSVTYMIGIIVGQVRYR